MDLCLYWNACTYDPPDSSFNCALAHHQQRVASLLALRPAQALMVGRLYVAF